MSGDTKYFESRRDAYQEAAMLCTWFDEVVVMMGVDGLYICIHDFPTPMYVREDGKIR